MESIVHRNPSINSDKTLYVCEPANAPGFPESCLAPVNPCQHPGTSGTPQHPQKSMQTRKPSCGNSVILKSSEHHLNVTQRLIYKLTGRLSAVLKLSESQRQEAALNLPSPARERIRVHPGEGLSSAGSIRAVAGR